MPRPAETFAPGLFDRIRQLLAAGIHVVEHLTNLAEVPPTGARFSAVPPKIRQFGTFPVRAFARLP